MRVISYSFSACGAAFVTLEPNEEYRFADIAASRSIGLFMLAGDTEIIEGPVQGQTFTQSQGLVMNDAVSGWSNTTVGQGDMLIKAGPNGAHWLCLSEDGVSREIEHHFVDGQMTLPAGWGVIVASGSVEAENLIAITGKYFRPRVQDILVSGTADLLLVR